MYDKIEKWEERMNEYYEDVTIENFIEDLDDAGFKVVQNKGE